MYKSKISEDAEMKKKLSQVDKIMLLVELSSSVCQCVDILTCVSTMEMDRQEYYMVFDAIVEKMKTF